MDLPLCILLWLCWTGFVFTAEQDQERYRPENHNPSKDHPPCRPAGDCEPCPREVLNEPFCQPFGNRRLMHCINELNPSGDLALASQHPEGETSAWQSCGRIVSRERADFFEFVGCNVVLTIVAILIVLWRLKRMHLLQTRQLAARIGPIRG